jgi:hypothetical protein
MIITSLKKLVVRGLTPPDHEFLQGGTIPAE